MDTSESTERSILEACMAGSFEVAASVTLSAYRKEIFSFLSSRLRGFSCAQDAYSMFAEDLWRGLPKFAWRCSMRTWCYTLARNAAARYAATLRRRAPYDNPLSLSSGYPDPVGSASCSTLNYQRTSVKERFRQLREQLHVDDQMLLVLRVDRKLSWRDLAMAMRGDVELDDEALARESARLRKSFERLKLELRRLVEQDGLLTQDE